MQYVIILFLTLCLGCSPLEIVKTMWGSSTRALEQARDKAITKVYQKSYWECVRASLESMDKNEWTIFKKDEIKGYVVLLGIKGAVDTTEVGVFFEEMSDGETRIEISSLSTNAKRIIAKHLFYDLDVAFGLIIPEEKVEAPPGEEPAGP